MEFYGESPQYTIPTKVASSDKAFTSRVDQIVVASIERYMWGKGFDKRSAYWEKTRSGGLGEKDNYVRVSFPDGSGKGGGLVTYRGNFFQTRFITIIRQTLIEFETMGSVIGCKQFV